MSRSTICSRVLCFAALVGVAATALGQGTPTPTRTVTPGPMISATPTPTGVSSTPTRTPTSLVTVTVTPLTTVTPTAGPSAPTSVDQCKDGGWRNFTNPTFKNQGDCVSFVASQGRARGNPGLTRTPTPAP